MNKSKVLLTQSLTGDTPAGYEVSGTNQAWGQQIGRYMLNNSRGILAVCAALAPPLLKVVGMEGGGFHFVGPSSCGKTTLLRVAASVSGNPATTIKTLDATASNLEAAAAVCNDGLLILDELGQAAPDALGGLVYKLASGIGRGRADQRGEARERKSWRNLFLTTGEVDMSTMLKTIGKRPAAGQELRLVSIPAVPDGSGGNGIYENLHGLESGAALSDHFKQATSQYHGAPLRAYLEVLVHDLNQDSHQLRQTFLQAIKDFVDEAVPAGSDGQVMRVAARFGLLSAAGEYAARHGVLPWPEGEAAWGVRECFNAWLQRRGGYGPLEVKNLLETFEGWLQTNGEARFTPMDGELKGPARPVVNRAGFRRQSAIAMSEDSGMEYFIFPAAFREAIGAAEPRWAARVLVEHGWLSIHKNGDICQLKKLPGAGACRIYHVPSQVGSEDAEEI
jgi:putative DNA primase/helicase